MRNFPNRLLMPILFFLPLSVSSQYVIYQNTQHITIPDAGPASPYPSLITVSGQPPYLTNLFVNFQSVFHGNGLGDADVLLEAPNGQKIILFSDVLEGQGIFVLLNNLNFGSGIYRPFTIEEVQNGQYIFHPTNDLPNPENFPAPGPGTVDQPLPSLHALDGINPNGVWKLWVVSDEANGFDGSLGYNNALGNFGWELAIAASNTKPCERPDLPVLDVIEDTYVRLGWPAYGGQSTWDLYYAIDPAAPPQANTTPTLNNVSSNNNFQINDLEPNRLYQLWVRGDCGNGQTSDWVGPVGFRTAIYPCLQPIAVSICDSVNLLALPSFNYWKPASCQQYVADETPKRMLQFTPPKTGKYDLQHYGIQFGHVAFKPATGPCDTSGWVCLDTNVPGYSISADLVAGTTYWFFVDGGDLLKFDFCPWPSLNEPQLKPVEITPSKGNFRWAENNQFYGIGGDWDIYFAPQNAAPPGYGTTPTETDFDRDTFGYFTLNQSLQANKAYNLFIRYRCSDDWGCWSKPTSFVTPAVTAVATNFYLDTAISYPGYFNASAILKWEAAPGSLTVPWQATWGAAPHPDPGVFPPVGAGGGSPVTFQVDGLNTATTYDFWLRPGFPGVPAYPYWQQDWQGPFQFATYEPCVAANSGQILCNQLVGGNWSNSYNVFSPASPCGGASQANAGEIVRVFQSTVSTPIEIRPRGADGQPGALISVYYKKASGGCGISGWTHIGCWEMGQVQNPLGFTPEKDTTYYLLFDTYGDTPFQFNFEIEQCSIRCETPKAFTVTYSDANSVTLAWKSVGTGATYDVDYAFTTQGAYPDWNNPKVNDWPDTILVLNNLEQDTFYDVFLRAVCPDNAFSSAVRLDDVPTGADHPYQFLPYVTDCNPAAQRALGIPGLEYRYESVPFTVPAAGIYTIRPYLLYPNGNFLAIYRDSFDANAPYENLVANSDTTFLDEGISDVSAMLEPGKQYYLQVYINAPVASPQESQTYYQYVINGPGFAQMEPPIFQGRLARPHGKIWEADGTTFFQYYTCADTAGWVHFFVWQPAQRNDHFLLFSTEYYDALKPYYYALPYGYVGGTGGAIRIQNPPALYASNPSGWYVMNRFWNLPVILEQQPEEAVKLRYYYTEQDFQSLRDSVIAAGGMPPDNHEQLYFYKINDFFNRYDPDPGQGHADIPAAVTAGADGFREYFNGTAATDSTWRHDVFNNGHLAEMVVRHFSGGGGGIGVNLKGAVLLDIRPVLQHLPLRIYPNPVSDWLIIKGLDDYGTARIFLRNLTGKTLLHQTISPEERLQIGHLPSGAYLLTVETENGMASWKVIKF